VIGTAKKLDDDQLQPLYAGAAVASMSGIPGAGEVVTTLEREAVRILARRAEDLEVLVLDEPVVRSEN